MTGQAGSHLKRIVTWSEWLVRRLLVVTCVWPKRPIPACVSGNPSQTSQEQCSPRPEQPGALAW